MIIGPSSATLIYGPSQEWKWAPPRDSNSGHQRERTGLSKLSLCQGPPPTPRHFHVHILFMLSIRNMSRFNIWEWFPLLPPKVYCKCLLISQEGCTSGWQKLVPRGKPSTDISPKTPRIANKGLSGGWVRSIKGSLVFLFSNSSNFAYGRMRGARKK